MRLPLATLEVFDAIAREGSMRGAARSLGVKPSTVSHQLKKLEESLGTALFIRTTRSISMTEAGRALARNTTPAFEQLGEGLLGAQSVGHSERGTLKLVIPEFAYFLLVEDKLASFQSEYPGIEVELSITDALSDIMYEGFHAGFRLGGFVAEDMVAIGLTGPLQTAVVASRAYIETHGMPEEPLDLLNHNCLRYRFHTSGQIAPWTFEGPDGPYSVKVRGNLIANSLPVTLKMAEQGQGLAFGFRDYCSDALANGELTEVLAEHTYPTAGIHIYFPREYRAMTPLRRFITHLKD